VEYSPNAEIGADPAACELALLPGLGNHGRGKVLARLLETASQPFVATDIQGRIVSANPAFATLVGEPAPMLSGRTLGEFTTDALRPSQSELLRRVRETGAPARYQGELRREDGGLIPVEVALELDRNLEGKGMGLYAFFTDLSERKTVENALRESEERFRRLYDNAPVGYHEVDTEGRIVNINRTECEILGFAREELVGHSVFELISEEFRETARRAFPDKISGRIPLKPFERTVVTRDGRRLVISIEERYKRDEEGRVRGLLSTMRDVTEQKRTEAALVASEKRARVLFEGIEDAVFVHALDGRILDANPAACRLLGYTHAEMLTMTTLQVDDPEFAAGYEDRLARQLSEGHLSCEGRHRTKDGRVIPVEINTSTIQLDEERAVLAVIRDISERRALEETRRAFAEAQVQSALDIAAKNAELILSEERYRQLTEACLDGVVVVDRAGLVTLFNPAAERMFGHESAEVIGRPVANLMPASFRCRDGLTFDEDVLTRVPALVGETVEVMGRRKEGDEFPLELSLSSVERGGELQFIGSIRDQTERQRMRAMLAQSEKLASIGLLSAGVAHEINNPLAYVGNNLAVLERDLASMLEMVSLYEQARPAIAAAEPAMLEQIEALSEAFDWPYVSENLPGMIARTREGVQRVATIVSNLRGLARTSPPKMEAARIPDLLESALEMLRGRLRRHNIAVNVTHGNVPSLVCVPTQISQVLLNLLINAAQAVEMTGRADGGHIRFTSALVGSTVMLVVADNGSGIEPENIPRLFDPFFTTKTVGEGTGLGLSICHGIVTGHGGRIEVETRQGEGTTFRVLLPVKPT
jgi:PAS domain S-box-containing protein